jgi:hypothetical protein
MKVVNTGDIGHIIGRYAGRDEAVRELMQAAFINTLQKDPAFLKTVEDVSEIPSKKLARRFKRAASPSGWYRFESNSGLEIIMEQTCLWFMKFVSDTGRNYSGAVAEEAHKKLHRAKSVRDVSRLIVNGPLLSADEIEHLKKTRKKPLEEFHQHIQHEASLSGRHELFRITDREGLKKAAQNADNCLWDNHFQNSNYQPHKQRFKQPERWLYYTVRDADNRSVLTLLIDKKHNEIQAYPNGREHPPPPFTALQYALREEAEIILRDRIHELSPATSSESHIIAFNH